MSSAYSEKKTKIRLKNKQKQTEKEKEKEKGKKNKKYNLEDSDNNYKKKEGARPGGKVVKRNCDEKYNNNNNYREEKNIYDVCKIVEKCMLRNCRKYNILPQDLYEELHYQLPEEWIQGLRFVIRNSERQQLKVDYDISQTESNCSSEI